MYWPNLFQLMLHLHIVAHSLEKMSMCLRPAMSKTCPLFYRRQMSNSSSHKRLWTRDVNSVTLSIDESSIFFSFISAISQFSHFYFHHAVFSALLAIKKQRFQWVSQIFCKNMWQQFDIICFDLFHERSKLNISTHKIKEGICLRKHPRPPHTSVCSKTREDKAYLLLVKSSEIKWKGQSVPFHW